MKVNAKADLTGNLVVINDNWYYLCKIDEPKHLSTKPLVNFTIQGTFTKAKR
jgi:hypothetical protein